jgi:ABC-type transporter Mla MlaB component
MIMEKKKSIKKRKSVPRVAANSVADTGPTRDPRSSDVQAAVSPLEADAGKESKYYLEPTLQIKDVEDAHRQLTAMLAGGGAMLVDVSRVGAVDTAGVQLLLAFQGEAVKRGVSIEFHGRSAAITHALTALGLRDVVRIAI